MTRTPENLKKVINSFLLGRLEEIIEEDRGKRIRNLCQSLLSDKASIESITLTFEVDFNKNVLDLIMKILQSTELA